MSPGIMRSFFFLGVFSALAFRLLIVFHHINPVMVRPVWYTGVLGYTVFFLYRYEISKKRKKAVKDFSLLEKISEGKCLHGESQKAAEYLLRSITSSREDVNYLVIFVLSILAVLLDIAFTYTRS